MRFLVDNALSPLIAEGLKAPGYDAVSYLIDRLEKVALSFLQTPPLEHCLPCGTRKHQSSCYVNLSREPDRQLAFLLINLIQVADALKEGAVAVFEGSRIRVRLLPIDLATESTEL